MPGPGGINPALNKGTVNNNTGQHQQHYTQPNNNAVGAGSSFIGAAVNFAMNERQNMINSRRYKQEREDNRRDAATAYNRQYSLMKETERYNSVQNQVNMLREAGLNPALAYGSLGSASVSTPSADQASAAAYQPAADGSAVAAPVAALPSALSTMQDVQQKAITNKYLDTKSSQEIFKMIAETDKLLADTSLTNEEKQNLIAFRSDQIKLLRAQTASQEASAQQSKATADYTSGTLTDLGKSQIDTERTKQALNTSSANLATEQAITEPSKRLANKASAEEYITRANLNYAARELSESQKEELEYKNDLTRRQKDMIDQYCREHGYDPGVASLLYKAADSAGPEVGKNLSSWLDAGNWLPFISDMVRNFTWKDRRQDESPDGYHVDYNDLKSGKIHPPALDEPGTSLNHTGDVKPRSYEDAKKICERRILMDPVYSGDESFSKSVHDRRAAQLNAFWREFNTTNAIPDSDRPKLLGELYELMYKSSSSNSWSTFQGWTKMLDHFYGVNFEFD